MEPMLVRYKESIVNLVSRVMGITEIQRLGLLEFRVLMSRRR